jgi:hypothetical protein
MSRSAEVAQALAALRELPDADRETMILRSVEGLTGPEIAQQTGRFRSLGPRQLASRHEAAARAARHAREKKLDGEQA